MTDQETENRTIRLKIWIGQEPKIVYRALTEHDGLASWLVPSAEQVEDKSQAFLFTWPHHSFEVELLETIPERHVTMSWFQQNGVGPTVRWDIEKAGEGCIVTLTHEGFDSDPKFLQTYCDHIEGWTMYLCNLRCRLDFDGDLRTNQPPGTVAL